MDLLWQHAGEAYHLPSNKELADELGIARNTAQLEIPDVAAGGAALETNGKIHRGI